MSKSLPTMSMYGEPGKVYIKGGIIAPKEHAALIAAAPEMLAELKHLRSLVGNALDSGIRIPGLATMNAADRVIAKAEGK